MRDRLYYKYNKSEKMSKIDDKKFIKNREWVFFYFFIIIFDDWFLII